MRFEGKELIGLAHGGKISVASVPEDGTTFVVELPLTPGSGAAQAAVASEPSVG